ncbi:hypothetical protein EV175_001794 [Coemansia sp. RSA 1933]|nr:hypothetical protein EV175_001794 [Coemansia sp. RSA 1933]
MAAGRRRRNSSSVNKSSQSASSGGTQPQAAPKEEAASVSNPVDKNQTPIVEDSPEPSSAPAPLTTESHDPLPVDDLEDDPFAYDSDLETLSSVSSQLSISSPSSSVLDHDDLELKPEADMDEQEDGESTAADKNEAPGTEIFVADENKERRGSSKRKTPSSSQTNDNEEEAEDDDDDQKDAELTASHRSTSISSSRPAKRARRQRGADNDEESASLGENGESGPHTPEPEAADDDEIQADAQDESTPDHQMEEPTGAVMYEGSEKQDEQPPSAEGAETNNDSGSQDEDAADNEARRSAAFAELTSIEIEFAQLRERLYIERLQQVQVEEEYLLSGRHAEYERHASDITRAHKEQVERLQYEQQEWLKQRQNLHQTVLKSTNYTFLVRRQELRTRMLNAQRKRMWRLRDARVQEDRRFAEMKMASAHMGSSSYNPLPIDEDVALITQQTNSNIQQLRWARRAATNAQRCLVHGRKQRLAAPGLDPAEMDADYLAMNLPVYPREQKSGFRHIYVPPFILDADAARAAAGAAKKRKPRQPRQPKKKRGSDKDDAVVRGSGGAANINGGTATSAAACETKTGGSSSKGRGSSVDMRVPAGSNNPLGLKV